MFKGIQLTLMIGPAVPIPVSRDVLDALTGVQVVTTAGETTSGFELTFSLNKNSPLQTLFLLSGGVMPPIVRVVIVVTINGTPDVLMDGVITHHQISSPTPGGTSTLTLNGQGSHSGHGSDRLQRHPVSGDAGFRARRAGASPSTRSSASCRW